MNCLICGSGKPSFLCKAQLYPGQVKDIVSCPDCEAAYYFPVPSFEEIARCYPHAYFGDFFKQYWKDFYKGRFLAESVARWRRSGRILDVGCALGTFLKGFSDSSSWSAVGVEFSAAAAAAGRELNGIEIHAGALAAAPIPPESLDYVHMNNVLEHESDPFAALKTAVSRLKPGGRLHLTIPNGFLDLYPTKTLFAEDGRPRVTRHGGHLFFLTRRSLDALLSRCGLKVLFFKNFHFESGLKARGLKPGAWSLFEKELPPPQADKTENMPLRELRKRIGMPPPFIAYALKARWRRLARLESCDFGYDYEILAEKTGLC